MGPPRQMSRQLARVGWTPALARPSSLTRFLRNFQASRERLRLQHFALVGSQQRKMWRSISGTPSFSAMRRCFLRTSFAGFVSFMTALLYQPVPSAPPRRPPPPGRPHPAVEMGGPEEEPALTSSQVHPERQCFRSTGVFVDGRARRYTRPAIPERGEEPWRRAAATAAISIFPSSPSRSLKAL